MEFLLQAIEEKLADVSAERDKWLQYQKEHKNARKNLRFFEKAFRKDVLVPIGTKAFMPGTLYHTNEVFCSLYDGLFVRCSTDKALLLCQHRLKEAENRLKLIEVEYNMYKNRLEVPSAEQAFGNDECQEIIEEYDEQTELKWRERHKASVREHKSKEALERQQIRTEINDVEIWDKLEHNEMMEELENEMEDLDEDAAEQMNLIDSMLNLQLADTNNTANIECSNIDEIETEQFNDLRKEAEHLSNTDKIKFYEKHLLDLDERLATKSSHDSDELAEMHVTEGCLREAIAEIQEEINTDSSDDSDCLDNSYTSDESDASGDDRSFYCDSKNDEQRIGKYMASSPDSPKCKSVIEFASVEAEYDKLNKTKSELLIFYKSQLRYVNKIDKNISAESNEEGGISLVEFVLNRIDELRVDILQEKQKKVEEDFVDDDDNIFKKPSKCRQFYLDRLRDADGYNMANDEDGGKRRIKFAAEPEITTFDKEDEPFRIQNESNRESFSEFIDKKFEFFTSPMNEEYESESFDCNKTVDVGTMMAESSGSVDTEDNVVVNSTDNNNVDKCEIEVNRPDDLMQGSSEESLLLPPLIIEFEHSTAQECHTDASSENDFLDSPVDIYKMFGGGSPPKETLRHECDEEPAHMVFLKKYIANRDCHGKTQENTQAQTANTETDKAVDAERAAPIFEAAIPNANVQPGRSILKKRKTEPEHEACHEVPEYKQDNEPVPQRSNPFPGFTEVVGDVMERSDPANDILESVDNNQGANVQSTSKFKGSRNRVSLFKKSRES